MILSLNNNIDNITFLCFRLSLLFNIKITIVFLDINLAIVTDDISDPFGRYVLRTAYTLRVKYSTTNRGEVTVTLEPRLHEFPLSLCFPEKEQEEEVSLESFTTRKGGDSDDINIGIYMSNNSTIDSQGQLLTNDGVPLKESLRKFGYIVD